MSLRVTAAKNRAIPLAYANLYVSLDFSFNFLSNQCSPDRRTTRDRSYRMRRYDEAVSIVSAMATMAKMEERCVTKSLLSVNLSMYTAR